jgi:hypothetical protein
MAAKAKKQAKAVPKKKEVKASRRKTHQKGLVAGNSAEMTAQRKKSDSKKTGLRKQSNVRGKGTSTVTGGARKAAGKQTVVRRVRKPSSATTTPAPADAGMPAGLSEVGG